jgi:DNA-directed RNA polymerase subunit F
MKTHRYFQVAAISFALVFANSAPAYCQSPQNNPASAPPIQTVKDQVQKIGKGEDVTVILISGVEYYGQISKIEPDSFEIAEVDLKQMVAIPYADVKKVEKGYGEMNSSGKRQNDPDTARRTQIVKDQVQTIGIGEDVTVMLVSGVEYYGAISKIEPDSFEIAEVDLKQMVTIAYADALHVEGGYGAMNPSTGKREKPPNVKPPSSRSFWIFAIAGMGAMVGLTVWAFSKLGRRQRSTQFPRIP